MPSMCAGAQSSVDGKTKGLEMNDETRQAVEAERQRCHNLSLSMLKVFDDLGKVPVRDLRNRLLDLIARMRSGE